jgi:hypothetical protein
VSIAIQCPRGNNLPEGSPRSHLELMVDIALDEQRQ